MTSKSLKTYFDDENLEMRVSVLRQLGHESNVWGEQSCAEIEWVVEIVDPCYVSKPCWQDICESADKAASFFLDLNMFRKDEDEPDLAEIYQFFFSDLDTAKAMALRVQSSARNKRKDDVRRIRLEDAGGFHDKNVLDKLFEIQQGRCYYSGELLTKQPKNYVVDHIQSIYSGGTNWPGNLALVLKGINTWKGGHATAVETLKWLAKERGQQWFREQKKYCKEIDVRRAELDKEFRRENDIDS